MQFVKDDLVEVSNSDIARQLKFKRLFVDGLKQKDVADILGIHATTYCSIEGAKLSPTKEQLEDIYKYLGKHTA